MIADGISNLKIFSTKTYPVVYAVWLLAGSDKFIILINGYFDVQTVDPLHLWDISQFESVIRNNRLFGPGASDDKGNM